MCFLWQAFQLTISFHSFIHSFFYRYYGEKDAQYKEPGNSWIVGENAQMDEQYLMACVDASGTPQNCTHKPGSKYIRCGEGSFCGYKLCEDDDTQRCSEGAAICELKQKWCQDYEVAEYTASDPPMGYVTNSQYCLNEFGVISEEPGTILQDSGGSMGNCYYTDGKTEVQRTGDFVGDYTYCQKSAHRGQLKQLNAQEGRASSCDNCTADDECDTVYTGAYQSLEYDPRYRGWYIDIKQKQKPAWSAPYTDFFTSMLMITYSAPFYTKLGAKRTLFSGVFAVDITFEDVTKFLTKNFPVEDDTFVVVYETAEPNFMIAASTGRSASKRVLVEDESTPCPIEMDDKPTDTHLCTEVRVSMHGLKEAGEPYDDVLTSAYLEQKALGYPKGELVSSRTESHAYVSQSSTYTSGDEVDWTILIISVAERSEYDALTTDSSLFVIVCLIASFGFLLCSLMCGFMYRKRKTRAVILADWRFTLAFLGGCALLNLSSFTLLGENTDSTCLARMWCFRLFFAMALSPLFVKVWRMHKLVGSHEEAPQVISNPRAVALAMPIVLIQLVILCVFTGVDPSLPKSTVTIEDAVVMEVVSCTQESNAFIITILVYEASLVVIGCILAYLTRNLSSGIGQAKELMFSMYNIAFVGFVTTVIAVVVDVDATGQATLLAMGIFCGTVFSSAAFVLPSIYTGQSSSILKSARSIGASIMRASAKSKSPNASAMEANSEKANVGKTVSFGPPAVTGWSAMDDDNAGMDEDDNGVGSSKSKTFANTSKKSLPAISGWSAMEDDEGSVEEKPDLGLDALRGSKEFSGHSLSGSDDDEECSVGSGMDTNGAPKQDGTETTFLGSQ